MLELTIVIRIKITIISQSQQQVNVILNTNNKINTELSNYYLI